MNLTENVDISVYKILFSYKILHIIQTYILAWLQAHLTLVYNESIVKLQKTKQ